MHVYLSREEHHCQFTLLLNGWVLIKKTGIYRGTIANDRFYYRKMAKLVQGPPRFTHPEWTTSNLTHYANAESERAAAERLVEESKRLSDETAKRTEKTQRDVNKKLGMFKLFCWLFCHPNVSDYVICLSIGILICNIIYLLSFTLTLTKSCIQVAVSSRISKISLQL